jgi:hypothetical protein
MARLPAANENVAIVAAIVPTTTYYLSLHSADPGTTGATEVSGGSYARQSIVFGSATAGVVTSTTAQNFTAMPAESGGVPFFGIWSASSGGTYEGGGTTTGLSTSIPAGASINFASASVTCSIS